MAIVVLILIGMISAIIGSLIGIGGGIIIVPTLVYLGSKTDLLTGITTQTAVGISSLTLVFTGLFSIIAYRKKGKNAIDLKHGFLFSIGIIPGSLVGAYLSRFLNDVYFNIIFGIFLFIISIVLIVKDYLASKKSSDAEKKVNTPVAIIFSFFVGISAGLFGIGGGVLMTPLMIIAFNFSPHVAVATSMIIIFTSSLASTLGHIVQGHVIWHYGLVLIIASYVGTKIGVTINRKIDSAKLSNLLKIVLILMSIYLIYKGFSEL
ncbi:sulfite exporter TauE/SafE family protein [Helicobacter pylori]